MTSSITGSWIHKILNPLPRRFILYAFILYQMFKLGIILAQPNSEEFQYWFYKCFQYPPYSWDCRTINGLPFPMPYSLFWYAVYVPLTARGYWVFNLTMLSVDTITGLIIARRTNQIFTGVWFQGSFYFLIVSPQDFLIWTIMLMGRTRLGPLWLMLAVLTKFPLIPPIYDPSVWSFIISSPVSVHDPLNWARYTMLGFYWLLFLGIWFWNRGILTRSRMVNKIIPRSFLEYIDRK